MAKKKPVGIVVRRGALRRFDALTRKTAELPVVVTWDRRTEIRRSSDEPATVERRSGDRRKAPPFTWDVADFVVFDIDGAESGATGARASSVSQDDQRAAANRTPRRSRARR
jgi:hypothetical protein